MKRRFRPLVYLWVLPATLLGLALVPLALLWGGSARVVDGVLEVEGGLIARLLRRGLPWTGPGAAITLGHVVLGCDPRCLDFSRAHERVHVRQYERLGPLFIPAYLAASFRLLLCGRHPYLDNPFEREAFDETEEKS